MNKAIRVTFWQFEAQLSEWIKTTQMNEYKCEIFSLYAAGYDVEEVAEYIEERLRDTRLH